MPSTLNTSILTAKRKVGLAIRSDETHRVFTAKTYKGVGQQHHMGLWHINFTKRIN